MSTFLQICNRSWSCRTNILEGATFHKISYWDFFPWDFSLCVVLQTTVWLLGHVHLRPIVILRECDDPPIFNGSRKSPVQSHVRALQANITIWVLRKVCIYTVLTRTGFHFCSRLHWKFMRWLGSVLTSCSGFLQGSVRTLSSTKFSLNSCSQSGSSYAFFSLYFFWFSNLNFVFGFCGFMQRVSPKLSTRTSTSFLYWIFCTSVDINHRILRWRCWRSRWRWRGGTRW